MTDQNENIEADVEDTLEEGTMAADSLKPASKSVSDPKSKVEYLTAIVGTLAAAKKDDLVKWFDQVQSQFGPNKDWGVGDKSAANQATVDMKGGKGPKTKDAMPKISVKEDVEEMFVGEDLSEEFKEKASTLFEASVAARTSIEIARLEEEYEEQMEIAVAEINEELTGKLDTYLDYVVENWIEQNEVAIESALRNELMEEFLDGLKNLFAEHYMNMPQEKVEVVEALATKVEELEARLNETISENTEMKQILAEVEKDHIFESMIEDLALSQQEKFRALSEGIDFDGDLEAYAKKLLIVKENYFATEKRAPSSTNIVEETFEGEVGTETVAVDPSVNRYVQAISRTIKK
jgi:hypothetical protein